MAHLRARQKNDKKRTNGNFVPMKNGRNKGQKRTQQNGKTVHVNKYEGAGRGY